MQNEFGGPPLEARLAASVPVGPRASEAAEPRERAQGGARRRLSGFSGARGVPASARRPGWVQWGKAQ
eukprot:11158714-Lingulodinium_polyedra.AAC.1